VWGLGVVRAPARPLNGLTLFGLGLRMFLRHRTFIGPRMFLFTPRGAREAIRIIAQRFANEVGVENVVAIVEHADSYGPFSMVVWFKSTEAERGMSSRVYLTNRDIRAIIEQSPDKAFPIDPVAGDSAAK
jgi:hypothetical protein